VTIEAEEFRNSKGPTDSSVDAEADLRVFFGEANLLIGCSE
jgi:hypothetical protein